MRSTPLLKRRLQLLDQAQNQTTVEKLHAVKNFVHNEETVTARRALGWSADTLRRLEALAFMPYLCYESPAIQPAIYGQRRSSAMFDAVRQRLAACEFETDQILAGKPVPNEIDDASARASRTFGRARKALAKLRSRTHEAAIQRGGTSGDPRSGALLTPDASRIACTSRISPVPSESLGGQLRSGDVHPCHVTRSVVPNEALFMHGTVVAFPLRAAARSAKNRVAVSFETVNVFGVECCDPARCTETAAEPSD